MGNNNYSQKYFEDRNQLDVLIAEPIKLLMNDLKLKKVLDVGCGTGKLVEFLTKSGFEAFGCDFSIKAVNIARTINKKSQIKKSSASKLPYRDKTFDIVTSISVIEHLTQKETQMFIKETRRILKDNGFIFLITPNFSSPARYICDQNWFGYSDPTHIQFFTPKTLKILLIKNKFNNIKYKVRIPYMIKSDAYLLPPLRKFPRPIKYFFNFVTNYLLISSPLSILRDSFLIYAQK